MFFSQFSRKSLGINWLNKHIFTVCDAKSLCTSPRGRRNENERKIEPILMAYTSYEETSADSAQKTPLVVMHGLFGSKSNWNSLCKAYQRSLNCKVYAVDARNHGDSPHSPKHSYQHLAEDIRHFLREFSVQKCKLVGHSMGGRAVMYFALKYPEMVEKLLVVDISPIGSSTSLNSMPPLFEFMAKVKMPTDGTIQEARNAVDKQLMLKITDKPLRSFLLTNVVQKGDGTFTWRVNLRSLLANFRTNIALFPQMKGTENRTFDGKTLFIGGGLSDYIPKEHEKEIKKIFTNAEIKYIQEAGHWVHSQKPGEFLEMSIEFLKD